MDSLEAQTLLHSAGIEPEDLKVRLEERLDRQAETYRRAGKPVPVLLKRALDDLRPLTSAPRNESELARQAKAAVRGVMERVKLLRSLRLEKGAPGFTMGYRNKKELSDRDKKLLDAVAEELRKRVAEHRGS
jgi:hypothetical protein